MICFLSCDHELENEWTQKKKEVRIAKKIINYSMILVKRRDFQLKIFLSFPILLSESII